ncbi:MAG: S8 family serine peptidase [Bacteroidota bacterium]
MSRPFLLSLGLIIFSTAFLSAQRLSYRQGELIVQLGADVDAKSWIKSQSEIDRVKQLSTRSNIFLVRFDFTRFGEQQLRQQFWQDPAVVLVQLNHLITHRRRPDDQRYDDQWQYRNLGQINGTVGADLNIESAWDITTGGLTANGDTIVVAVIDNGVQLDHEDLIDNLWRNHDEIPGNNQDDDDNGYIDDYYGFNTAANNSDVSAGPSDDHGTPVMGIVGAVGNNSIGVTGVNWDVKVMNIRNNFFTSEAEVLQAYSYALDARILYDETNGDKGAYVVATNASWGVDRGNAEESPIWCGLYDRLGEAGIINMGATINDNIDVDVLGDLPTNCTSEFLIGVTELDTNDEIFQGAGFGNVSIDLGAYGRDVFTTTIGNSYGTFLGTSAATPHVTGSAALLYSAPCNTFAQLLEADPAAAALMVREVILTSVKPNTSLEGITVTGGRLDVGAAMDELMSRCSDCLAPTSFTAIPKEGSATDIEVDWRAIADLTTVNLRYRATGTTEWTTVASPTAPYTIAGLNMCASYEVQLTGACGSVNVATAIQQVETDGCCLIPEDLAIQASANQRFFLTWTPLLAGKRYQVRYRKAGDENWLTRTFTQSPQVIAGGIEPCVEYEFQFQTDCDTILTGFGPVTTLISSGCGACQESSYCLPEDFDNSREWISEVNLGNQLLNRSGAEDEGYTSFGELTDRAFVRGGVYPLSLTPAFLNGTDTEEFKVYIDWNQDGIFASNELQAEVTSTRGAPAEAIITVPEDAELLLTRMRVIMEFRNVSGGPCSDNGDGEVEDYCIRIAEADLSCPAPRELRAVYDEVEGLTHLSWQSSAAAGGDYSLRYRLQNSTEPWTALTLNTIQTEIQDLNLCGTYEVEVASICGGTVGNYRLFYFNDECTDTDNPRLAAGLWSVFPNPAQEETTVSWPANTHASGLRVFGVDGRQYLPLTQPATSQTRLDVSSLAAGLYLIELRLEDGRTGLKRLIVR